MLGRSHQHVEIPEGVLLSVQEITRAGKRPAPELPPWLRRVLPKSGVAGQVVALGPDRIDEEEEDPDDDDDFVREDEGAALSAISFDLRPGDGLGLAGNDSAATLTLRRIITGTLPPSSGSVVTRGRVAMLSKYDLQRYTGGDAWGEKALFIVAKFLGWPTRLIRSRWDEIEAFAQLEELHGLKSRAIANRSTMRLLFAAALHMDATVYVLDEGIPSDDEFGARCFDLVAQRQREGAAVIQRTRTRVDEVARLCSHVLWFEDGKVRLGGTPLEVAIEAEKIQTEELHPVSEPVLAELANDERVVRLDRGGAVEVELHVLRGKLECTFMLELIGQAEFHARLEQPDPFVSESPGLHLLRITIPDGLLPDGVFEGRLFGEFLVPGAKPLSQRKLLDFEVVVDEHPEEGDEADDAIFEISPEPWDEDEATENEVGWQVDRVPA
jgi:ABC-type polysaccharide/polyol phosphate transport system ATPase subunit